MKARNLEAIAARSYLALLDSVSPIKNMTSLAERRINWHDAGMYFDGMADPYKVFTFSVGGGNERRTVSMSTAELMKIDRAGFATARNELSQVLSELQQAGIVALDDPWQAAGAIGHYRHLGAPSAMLTDYPFTNDVYFANPNQKVEGMAIPKSVTPMYITPRALDRGVFSDDAMIRVMERIWAAVSMLHSSANCNASVSPAVHIAMNRLGSTSEWFNGMDQTARDALVPKTAGIPEMDVLRGSWADNRYFGDHGSDRSFVYSNKNAYLGGLGNARDSRVPDIYRDGDMNGDHTRFVNPCFPEYLEPIHFAKLPQAGSRPNAGFSISGPSDARWSLSLQERRPIWTFSDQALIAMGNSGVGGGNSGRRSRRGMMPAGIYPGAGNLYSQWAGTSIPFDGDLASWENHASRTDETNGPYGVMRRLRDWYYANKPKCVITVSDAMTDFAAAVQLARFLSEVPPHVLLHSVMGYHNALLKLSFRQVNVPYSTSIDQYELNMRVEREAIAANAARFGLIDHGTTEPGYALTVKAPDSVVMADAGLQAATVGSLTAAAAVAAANPIAGLVCIALVGCAILVAELSGGRAQALVTPRDKSKEDLRSERNKGLRCNWFRGVTPEYVVNAEPVLRT